MREDFVEIIYPTSFAGNTYLIFKVIESNHALIGLEGGPQKQLWEGDGSFQADTIDGRRRGRVRETNWIRIIQLDLEIGVIPEKTIIHIQREREREGEERSEALVFLFKKIYLCQHMILAEPVQSSSQTPAANIDWFCGIKNLLLKLKIYC